MDDESDLGDIPFGILHAQAILANWRDRIRDAISEGEDEETVADTINPLPSTPAQRLALKIVDLAVVNMDAIELPLPKTKEQKLKNHKRHCENQFVTDCIKVTHFPSNSNDKIGESEEEVAVLQGRAIKTDLANNPDENSWNVTMKNVKEKANTFKVNEQQLLGGEFVLEHAYNDVTAQQKNKC
jgi:hypothetical protein